MSEKQAAPSPSERINEEEFDDLLYALKADTFEHGEDSQSVLRLRATPCLARVAWLDLLGV